MSKIQEANEMYALKEKAIKYYAENKLPEKIEEILNSTFYDGPNDVFGHVANYFESLAKVPTVTKVEALEVLDSTGQSAIQTQIYCMVKNFEKLLATNVTSNESYPADNLKPEEKDTIELSRQKSVTEAVNLIKSNFNDALKDVDVTKQEEVDSILLNTLKKLIEEEAEEKSKDGEETSDKGLEQQAAQQQSPIPSDSKTKAKSPKGKSKVAAVVIIPDEPREDFFCGCQAISALSQAASEAGASLKGEPLYKHLSACRFDEVPENFEIPLPMVTILRSGKTAPGKLNCVKEFMVVPKPDMPLSQSVKHIVKIYNHCAKVLSAKTGAVGKAVNDVGALWTTFDRPEQGLDMLQDAISQQELVPGEDFHLALNCAGHEIFDYEKGKYEVTAGLQKSSEDLADYWADLIGRYPALIAIFDPMRKQEQESWMRLCERVSEKCYIIGDVVHHRPGLLKEEEFSPDFRTSGAVLRLEHMNTISDIMAASKKLEDSENFVVVGTSIGESPDTFLADLSVACQAKFVKLGAPCRGERVTKINRLLQIEAELIAQDRLKHYESHTFPIIKPPTPPAEEEEETPDTEDAKTQPSTD